MTWRGRVALVLRRLADRIDPVIRTRACAWRESAFYPGGASARVRREYIKAALAERGTSLTAIARELKVSQAAITRALTDTRSERVERAIAAALGTTPQELFPERYQQKIKTSSGGPEHGRMV